MIQKVNIKKQIESRPKTLATTNNKSNGGLLSDPIFKVAQEFAENMDTKYKVMIGGAVWLIFAGAIQTVSWIYQLISSAF